MHFIGGEVSYQTQEISPFASRTVYLVLTDGEPRL